MELTENINKMLSWTVFIILVTKTNCKIISPGSVNFIKPCHVKSPECFKEAIQAALPGFTKGVPELGIPSLDPFVLDKVDLDLPGDLKISFRSGFAKGFRNCHVDFARLNGNEFDYQIRCNLTIIGKYRATGSLLVFSINGDGNSLIKTRNLRFNTNYVLGTKTVNGEKYLDIMSCKVTHSYDGPVFYHLTNLFKGNPQLGKAVVDFMNENWQLIAEEFGDPIIEFGTNAILKNIKTLFSQIPINQLFKGSVFI